ncbi:hypothetical protein SAMN06297387_11314 [Streptomyces zhaozhouensis]|uniref:Uncharacterized protein n=1 Tax=Streptomyces zhaozhouensis TaxID=1300267 RepID=A0A286DYW8_9ACTN|nr:hypothetical protein [Streptomyces zhaozhouensis]SOD63855.1 hypothetical protein SAMN06297387_11314 [Streptomyces zhaozhouensis]
MGTTIDAEQAWRDLQRVRVPQERVYDEVERSVSGGADSSTWGTAGLLWLFLAGMGLDPPLWGTLLALVVYVALLAALARRAHRGSRVRLHHTRYNWRVFATFVAGALVTGGTILLSGRLAAPLEPVWAGLVQATVTAAVFLLVIGPASRWSTGSLRGHGQRVDREGDSR